MNGPIDEENENDADSVDGDEEDEAAAGSTCTPETPDVATLNQMLAQWLPRTNSIGELLVADAASKTVAADEFGLGAVRVAYPCTVILERGGEQIERAGRTLEVAFAFNNLEWTQEAANRELKLRVRNPQSLADLADKLHNKVHSSN
ncbi:MAG: hypothetical protein AAF479_04460 [Pseudomonadota bacterium]